MTKGSSIMKMSAVVFIIVFCTQTSFAARGKHVIKCTGGKGVNKNKTLSCHTCMASDEENCEGGIVCCKGSCYTLIDKKHDIFAKGCTSKQYEDGSRHYMSTTVKLFANNEFLSGEALFCNKKDYCNSEKSLFASFGVLLFVLGVHQTVL